MGISRWRRTVFALALALGVTSIGVMTSQIQAQAVRHVATGQPGRVIGLVGHSGNIHFMDDKNHRISVSFDSGGNFTLPVDPHRWFAYSVQVDTGAQYGMAYSYLVHRVLYVRLGPDCKVQGLGKLGGDVLIDDPLEGGQMLANVNADGSLEYQLYPWVHILGVTPSHSDTTLKKGQFLVTSRNGMYYIKVASTSRAFGQQNSMTVGDGFRVSTFTSRTGHITVTGKNPGIHYLWIYVVHNGNRGQADSVHGYSSDGKFSVTIPLRYGIGKYAIQMFASKDVVPHMHGIPLAENPITGKTFNFTVTNNYPTNPLLLPSADIPSQAPQIVALAARVTAGQTSQYDKAKAIYQWMTQRIRYDYGNKALNTWCSAHHLTGLGENQDLLVYEVLDTHRAQCTGYAKLTAALNRAAGIPTAIADGPVSNIYHACDYVTIDGHSFNEDTCWGTLDPAGNFDPNPNTFAQTHTLTQLSD